MHKKILVRKCEETSLENRLCRGG